MQQPEQAMSVFFFLLPCLAFALPCLGAETRSRSLGDTQFSLENFPAPHPGPQPFLISAFASHTIHARLGSRRLPRLPRPCIWPGNPHHCRSRARRVSAKSKTAIFDVLPHVPERLPSCAGRGSWEMLLFKTTTLGTARCGLPAFAGCAMCRI